MKKLLRLVVFAMCLAWLMSLFGCGKEKPHMLDGPGMEYVPQWTEFTLSRSDSYAQYNFSFTVTDGDTVPMVSGVCRDENSNEYEEENGIPLTGSTIWSLRWLHLEQLPDAVETDDDDPEILDESICTLLIELNNGTVEKKQISAELSLQIYKLLLPYFINNQS